MSRINNRDKYDYGPKSFGMSARTSWFDSGDRSLPGPGQHQNVRLNQTNPPSWRVGRSTERDSFLQKYPRQYPSPHQYQPKYLANKTRNPSYSIPHSSMQHRAQNFHDENNSLLYKPNYNAGKTKYPQYSMGYAQQKDYSTGTPAPNQYQRQTERQFFNRTQRSFTSSQRPLPYGEHAKYPGVASYQVDSNLQKRTEMYSIGQSGRHDPTLARDSPGVFYDISGEIRHTGAGKTFAPQYPGPDAKKEEFPAPNNYNPTEVKSKRNIITTYSNRAPLQNTAVVKYPSPQKYSSHTDFYKKKSFSFSKDTRDKEIVSWTPGPGQHEIPAQLKSTSGVMGKKLKSPENMITPAADHYSPNKQFVAQSSPRVISLHSNRVDFSKSLTGKKVGPGSYQLVKDSKVQLGKMSKSMKFGKNYDKNPGPGSYQIPGGIGQLPKYYSGAKKITNDGYSTFTLQQWEKQKREQKRLEEKARMEEKKER